jgi:hypothetical protein
VHSKYTWKFLSLLRNRHCIPSRRDLCGCKVPYKYTWKFLLLLRSMYRILSREDLCGYNNYGSNNRVDIRSVCSCLTYSNFHGTCCNYYYLFIIFQPRVPIAKNKRFQTRKKNNLRFHLINK